MLSAPAPTFGTSVNYMPIEFPKAGRNTLGQSASAKDQEHQAALESAGFVFPAFVARGASGNVDHVGRIVQEYPRAMYDKDNKTALARNPDHQAELEANGWRTTPHDAAPTVPVVHAYGIPQSNPPLSDALIADIAELRSGHSAKIGELQVSLLAEKKAHAVTKGSLDQAVSDKEVLQSQLDKTANKNKAQMQKDLDDLQAKLDAIEMKYNELKMVNDQLLMVVGKPSA